MSSNTPNGGPSTLDSPTPTQNSQAQYPQHPNSYAPVPNAYPPASRRPERRGRSNWLAWVIGGTLGALLLVGLLIALVVALLGGFLASTGNRNEQTSTSSRTFAVSGTPSLVISNVAGNITVRSGGSDSQVIVQVTKRAWGSSVEVAQGGLKNTTVTMSRSDSTITVNTQFSSTYFDGGMARRAVDLLVTVPTQANVDLHLSAGNIDLHQITGVIRADSSAGNITTDAVSFADGSHLGTTAGNIGMYGSIARSATVSVDVNAGNATLNLPANTPAHLDAATNVGNLTIIGWQIPVSSTGVTGRHASGELSANPTARLTVQVSTGNLTLTSR